MNISSVLIIAKECEHENLRAQIAKIEHCSVELVEGEKMIVLIESENLDEELRAYKQLEKLKKASAVSMVFSYQDLDEDIANIKTTKDPVPACLNDDILAEDIEYSGSMADKY